MFWSSGSVRTSGWRYQTTANSPRRLRRGSTARRNVRRPEGVCPGADKAALREVESSLSFWRGFVEQREGKFLRGGVLLVHDLLQPGHDVGIRRGDVVFFRRVGGQVVKLGGRRRGLLWWRADCDGSVSSRLRARPAGRLSRETRDTERDVPVAVCQQRRGKADAIRFFGHGVRRSGQRQQRREPVLEAGHEV